MRQYIALDIRFGAAGASPIRSERREFWRWLAASRLPSEELCDLSPPQTLYISSKDIQHNSSLVFELIERSIASGSGGGPLDAVILDLCESPFWLLRDPVLFFLATSVVSLAGQRAAADIVIVLPEIPRPSSLFWTPFRERRRLIDGGNVQLSVLSSSGERLVFDTQGGEALVPFVMRRMGRERKQWERWQARLGEAVEVRVRKKLVRRLGHFERPGSGPQACSRYFFDGSLAVSEFGELFTARIRRAVTRRRIARPDRVAVLSPMSPWMEDVGMAVASGLWKGVTSFGLDSGTSGEVGGDSLSGKRVVLITDLVYTGTAALEAIAELRERGGRVEPVLFAAMSSGHVRELVFGGDTFAVDEIVQVQPEVVLRRQCEQCKLRLPFSRIDQGSYFGVRSMDAWTMFDHRDWIEERDIPPGSRAVSLSPDIQEIFNEFGDWLAYKIHDKLKAMGLGDELVVVAPDEPGATAILDWLNIQYQSRLVTVTLPRDVISLGAIEKSELLTMAGADEPDLWLKQLQHLAQNHAGVVMLDEFNASGRTAREMVQLARAFGISVYAYITFLDRAPGSLSNLGIPTFSLYEIDSPRQ